MWQIRIVCIVCSLLFSGFSYSAENSPSQKKQINAIRIEEDIKMDGHLDEAVWDKAEIATNFITAEPFPDLPVSQKTEVKILYSDDAIYFGAELYDSAPDSILQEMGPRDGFENNSDYFYIALDTYNDEINAFVFGISASGVQSDGRESANSFDESWNAVWNSKVNIHDQGWTIEIRIPYSMLRFAKKDVQTWGVNFQRIIRRNREKGFWNPIDVTLNAGPRQFGKINNIRGVDPPVRLALYPYLSANSIIDPDGTSSNSIQGGMDLKWGLNESFTLDATLIPDFSSVESDNTVLNLGPFEVYYNENRPFFNEGTELYNIGGLFYSRRIGGRPYSYFDVEGQLDEGEEITSNPLKTQLLNASKLSGRTGKNLGIGVFNAVTAKTEAVVEDEYGNSRTIETQPLTNYSIVVFNQALKNNSSISAVHSQVLRFSDESPNAAVTAVVGSFNNADNKYNINGDFKLSQVGTSYEDKGYTYRLEVNKTRGILKYGAGRAVESDTYNPNDLGFLQNNNSIVHYGNAQFTRLDPFLFYNRGNINFNVSHEQLYEPNVFTRATFSLNAWAVTKQFHGMGFNVNYRPFGYQDYFEARTTGRLFDRTANYSYSWWVSSDYRKRLAFDFGTNHYRNPGLTQFGNGGFFAPRIRVSNQFLLIVRTDIFKGIHDRGYATGEEDSIYIADRTYNQVTNTITGTVTFNPKMNLSLKLRHYWSEADVNQLEFLNQDGSLSADSEGKLDPNDYDVNFNAFNIDLIYRWEFRPGSFLTATYKNNLIDSNSDTEYGYTRNLQEILARGQQHNLNLKLVYFLDVEQLLN